ncbi:MAG: ABC transporter ATP-binding protein [Zymomonas mobilis]|uniref:Peptide/nickel transport system ATP-binding protein n=1 Tax=Zymomonas mobilis TaxID=542 RepID=A0A542W1B7_ZYMMB|nr:ABC transporter ATP-binding protein [Zymomonas mobilis]TQL17385.1 peptide/nickel transport system ATP-binding protein [Zymomonas mobilis]
MTFLAIEHLSVKAKDRFLLKDIGFRIGRGEIVGIIGESGSGKSTLARSILRLLPENLTLSGALRIGKTDLMQLSEKQMNDWRGQKIAFIGQDSLRFLDPMKSIGNHLQESIKDKSDQTASRVAEALRQVGLTPDMAKRYPHQLSGGQRQRAAIAVALASKPSLLIADEPSSALDMLTEAQIMAIFKRATENRETAILLISHNPALAVHMAERIVVLKDGELVSKMASQRWWSNPQDCYSQDIIQSYHQLNAAPYSETETADHRPISAPLLTLRNLSYQEKDNNLLGDINLQIKAGEKVAIIGESGAGKSTLLKLISGLLPASSGEILWQDQAISFEKKQDRLALYQKMQMVFQDPTSSLDPTWTVEKTVTEPLNLYQKKTTLSPEMRFNMLQSALEKAALPSDITKRYPATLSGGQCQRVAIARALVNEPELLLLDEAFSALDSRNRVEIGKSLIALSEQENLACLLVTHDLTFARFFATRMVILYKGRVIENESTKSIFTKPKHDYTQRLIKIWQENYNL